MQRQKKVPNFNLKLFSAGVFPYFEPFSRRLALKFQKSTNRAKKIFFTLFSRVVKNIELNVELKYL
jgi:hypothetical protein